MRLDTFRLAVALAILMASTAAVADDSVRCGGGLVAVGDLKIDLLGKCGEPTLREATQTTAVAVVRGGTAGPLHRATAAVERWTYDFGRDRFLQIVTLEAGRVVAIERGDRGYAEEPAGERRRPIPVATCDYMTLHVGDGAYDLVVRCGEPATQDVTIVERTTEDRVGNTIIRRSVTIPVEIWTYHFGPQTFTRVLEIENGKVVRIETGSHGYPN